MGIYGQDWASYQSAQPSTAGLSFAFVKITEGLGYVNPRWTSQRDHAKAGGLVWGAYHYPHMHNNDRAEADFFLSQVAWQPGDLVVLDWEGYDAANQGVSAADQLAYKEDYLSYVKGRLPHNPVGLYCNTDYWNRVDTTGHVGDFLWIATAGRAAGNPGISAPWLFHQYGDNPVDSDYCHLGNTAELRTWALSFAQPTPALEDIVTPQDIQDIANAVWQHTETNEASGQPVYMGAVMAWMDKVHLAQTDRVLTQLAATQAAITALATQLGQQHQGVDTAAVVAAVQQAIAAAVVNVHVDVTGTAAGSPPAVK